MDNATLYVHPTHLCAARPSGEVVRLGQGKIETAKAWLSGKSKAYPAVNIQRKDGSWTASTVQHLVQECLRSEVLGKRMHAHHKPGQPKDNPAFHATEPLDEVTHGRVSMLEHLNRRVGK